MSEILFRGFHPCKDGKEKVFVNGKWIKGKWVYGDFVRPCNIVYMAKGYDKVLNQKDIEICNEDNVIPETVGRFTGLTDKNNTKIFERDVLNYDSDLLMVIWNDGYAKFECRNLSRKVHNVDFSYVWEIESTVAGNVFSKNKLLGGDTDVK